MASLLSRLAPALIFICLLCGCNSEPGSHHRGRKAKTKLTKTNTTPASTYTVFLETTGSLDGYLNPSGDSNFAANVGYFISLLDNAPGKRCLNLYDINTQSIPAALDAKADEIGVYLSHLNPQSINSRAIQHHANRSQSNITKMLKTLVDTLDGDEVRVLITDAIPSPGKGKDAKRYLDDQRNIVQPLVSERLRSKSFSFLVLQFYASFIGSYYNQDDKGKSASYKDRPYYMICVGEEESLRNALNEVQHGSRFKGFRNFLFLTDKAQYNMAARIRPASRSYTYSARHPMMVSDMKKGAKDNRFHIHLLADLSKLPVDEAYLLDPAHYQLTPGDFIVESVKASDDGLYSHEILLSATGFRPGELKLELQRQLPAWIAASSLDEDRKATPQDLEGKTLGIRHLLEGMFQAYAGYTRQSTYGTISLTIKD
ncbi:hypothetical protein [Taibaiella koreensis]|uniref:hypothetical protein n=1 Tax=Taibaiella koreensis TaxID=1268548 RepID=UPI0013C31559|nr:hypothetical protein [Taibaiella koreensis]